MTSYSFVRQARLAMVAFCVTLAGFALVAPAGDISRLVNPTPYGTNYPYAIATDGQRIAAAFVLEAGYPGNADSGIVQIFSRQSGVWELEQFITGDFLRHYENFEPSVDIVGNWLAIGTPGEYVGDQRRGRVRMYEYSNGQWILRARLLAGSVRAGAMFGESIAFAGDSLIIGAPAPYLQNNRGVVYVYALNNASWSLQQVIPAPPEVSRGFGTVLAASGDRFVVGMPDGVAGNPALGAAYVYQNTGAEWEFEAALDPNYPSQRQFGASVDIAGDVIVVGDPARNQVFVFERDVSSGQWNPTRLTQPFDNGPQMGAAVATNGDTVYSSDGPYLGAYVRTDTGWETSFEFEDFAGWDIPGVLRHGEKIAMADDFVALSSQEGQQYPWSVYVVNVDSQTITDCNNNGTTDAIDVIIAPEADCNANGVPDECEQPADLDCNNNGQCDSYEIQNDLINDCNRNGIPDECEPDDGDGDGVENVCDNCPDLYNPGQEDCDGDDIGDACAIATGLNKDCDENGVPDECDRLYQYGEPWTDTNWYLNGDFDAVIMQEYIIGPGAQWINAVQVYWSQPYQSVFSNYWIAPVEFSTAVVLYRDPDNDGNPRNAVAMTIVPGMTGINNDYWTTYRFDDTFVGHIGERYYVGVFIPSEARYLPFASECPSGQGRTWGGAARIGTLNIQDLGETHFLGEFSIFDECRAIRAVPSSRWQCDCTADIASFDGKGGDGVIDILDVMALLEAWGDCEQPCPPSCEADFTDDCTVNVFDLMMMLQSFGPCQ